jgi:hypothetical protein
MFLRHTTTRLLALLILLGLCGGMPGIPAHAQGDDTMTRPLLLAHYMPWYQTPQVTGYWGWHWTMDHFDASQQDENGRPQIASQYMPLTGLYDSADPDLLEYQVLLMKLSGIDGVIVDWYGTENFRDYAVLNDATNRLFEATQRAGLLFSLCYEDQTIKHMIDDGHITADEAVARGHEDMRYAQEHWFADPSYVRYEGQPLLFVFGPQYFRDPANWEALFADLPETPALVTLDGHLSFGALTSYPWPPMNLSGGIELQPDVLQTYLDRFYRNANRQGVVFGSAFPAFYDIYEEAGVRSSYGYIDPRDGDTLRDTMDAALNAGASLIQLVTWNDYGEGTIIEPTEETGYQYLEIVQEYRTALDSEGFDFTPDDLRLPLEIFELRKAHAGDAEANARLDEAAAALLGGDTGTARDLLTGF